MTMIDSASVPAAMQSMKEKVLKAEQYSILSIRSPIAFLIKQSLPWLITIREKRQNI